VYDESIYTQDKLCFVVLYVRCARALTKALGQRGLVQLVDDTGSCHAVFELLYGIVCEIGTRRPGR
jgi:hypothetical protein